MTSQRLLLGATAAVTAAVALLLGGVGRDESRGAPPVAAAPERQVPAEFESSNTTTYVAELQGALRQRPDDVRMLGLLGLGYEQRARETADPAYYTKADGVLRRALSLSPKDLTATLGLGSLALSRHRFADALVLGRRAQALSPSTARTYGVIGDALVELGQYREGFAAFDRLASLKPGLSSYARVSYARELVGDFAGAVDAMRFALDAAVGEREPLAWTRVQLAKLYWGHGNVQAAAREARSALAAFPGYASAFDVLALTAFARGQLGRAIKFERRAVAGIPLPQNVATLGDLLARAGQTADARRQYALVGVIDRLFAANGARTDLELALFDVDHGIDLSRALARARRAHTLRPSIDADDVLAWALARTGHCAEALRWSRHALRLGTQDPLKFFHRSRIERCRGHATEAQYWLRRAKALNPHFSVLWSR